MRKQHGADLRSGDSKSMKPTKTFWIALVATYCAANVCYYGFFRSEPKHTRVYSNIFQVIDTNASVPLVDARAAAIEENIRATDLLMDSCRRQREAHEGEVKELRKAIVIAGRFGFIYGERAMLGDTNYSKEALIALLTNSYHIAEAP